MLMNRLVARVSIFSFTATHPVWCGGVRYERAFGTKVALPV